MSDLWNYGVAVSFDGFVSPLRKGNSVQFGGKPIISATNRGLSWEDMPSVSVNWLLDLRFTFDPLQSDTIGVGSKALISGFPKLKLTPPFDCQLLLVVLSR